jgi:hypothetical protein
MGDNTRDGACCNSESLWKEVEFLNKSFSAYELQRAPIAQTGVLAEHRV